MEITFQETRKKAGFTLIEIVVVIGIMMTLLGIAIVSTSKIFNSASINTAITTIETDFKSQQGKAMANDAEGQATAAPHGIYFESDSYTLFYGNIYTPADSSNFTVSLDSPLTFSTIAFPLSRVIFSTGSGEIVNFTQEQNFVVITNSNTQEQKTITVNRLGTIESVN